MAEIRMPLTIGAAAASLSQLSFFTLALLLTASPRRTCSCFNSIKSSLISSSLIANWLPRTLHRLKISSLNRQFSRVYGAFTIFLQEHNQQVRWQQLAPAA